MRKRTFGQKDELNELSRDGDDIYEEAKDKTNAETMVAADTTDTLLPTGGAPECEENGTKVAVQDKETSVMANGNAQPSDEANVKYVYVREHEHMHHGHSHAHSHIHSAPDSISSVGKSTKMRTEKILLK